MKTWMKKTVGPAAAIVLMMPVLAQCGAGLPGGIPGADQIPGGAKCPDMTSADAVAEFDWAGNYKVDAAVAGKLKGGLAAAIELKQISDSIDADLKTGCGGLATDLGAGGDFKTGDDACKAAIKVIGEVRAKLGAHASASLDIEPPKCGAEMSVIADCAAKCDATVSPGSAKVECEPGKCDGKCDGEMSGQCAGSCSGSCKLKGKAECKGTCTGGCSVEMKAPKCTGEVKPPSMSAECKGHCDAKAEAHVTCTPAHVGVRLDGGADAALQMKLKTALEKNLPIIAKIALSMGPRAIKLSGSIKEIVVSLESTVQAAGSSSGVTGAQLVACVAAPFKGVGDAMASLQANAKVSVDVKASAEFKAGGSGSGSASTK